LCETEFDNKISLYSVRQDVKKSVKVVRT
jgi:hypothetical protein